MSGFLPPQTAPPTPTNPSIEERINRLNRLRDEGVITEDEYNQQRERLLTEL